MSAWIQHGDIERTYYPGGYDAITVLADHRGDRDDVVLPDVSQWPEKRVAVPGHSDIARLSRQRRAGNMTDRAPERSCIGSFQDDRRKTQAWNFNAANEASGRDRRQGYRQSGGRGLSGPAVGLQPVRQQLLELAALPILENPGVGENEPAIRKHRDGGAKEQTLSPPQNPSQRFSLNYDSHLARSAW